MPIAFRMERFGESIHDLDRLSWREFEDFCRRLFERLGYDVEQTPKYDDGADLLATRDGERVAIQVKHCGAGKSVWRDGVLQVVHGMKVYGCTRGIVVTNRAFNRQAIRAASVHPIELWGREQLLPFLAPDAVPAPDLFDASPVALRPGKPAPARRPSRSTKREQRRRARAREDAVKGLLGIGAVLGLLFALTHTTFHACAAQAAADCNSRAVGRYFGALAVGAGVGATVVGAIALTVVLAVRRLSR